MEVNEPTDEGEESAVMALMREPGLVEMVVEKCGGWPEGQDAEEVSEEAMRLVEREERRVVELNGRGR